MPEPKTSGIYAIKKYGVIVYVGSAINFSVRWWSHRSELRKDDPNRRPHHNIHLQNSWNKYGEDAFEFVVLEECPIKLLLVREQHYIDTLPGLYNICRIAGSRLGMTNSPESKEKTRITLTGRKHPPERNANNSAAKMGNSYATGHVVLPEARERISAALTGRALTSEHKANISTSMTGIRRSAEHQANLNASHTGRKHSSESRAKMSASQTGKKRSPDSVAKGVTTRKANQERRKAEGSQILSVDQGAQTQ